MVLVSTLELIGGAEFVKMTGANTFTEYDGWLAFYLPRGRNDINRCRIVRHLRTGTYDMVFGKYRKGQGYTDVASCSGVAVENLRRVFTNATGLECPEEKGDADANPNS